MSAVADFKRTAKRKQGSPFSLRLSEAERAELERRAGSRYLGDYIRGQLFGDKARASKRRAPRQTDIAYAQALASIGQSEIPANLRSMAASARIGALPLTPDLIETIETTCRKIQTACDGLIVKLGVKPK